MKAQRITFEKFGGLDVDTQPLLAAQRAGADGAPVLTASVARNVYIDPDTREVRKTPGRRKIHTAIPGGAPPIIGLYEHVTSAGNRVLICRTRTGYYQSNDARTTWTLLHAAALNDAWLNSPSFAPLGDYLAIVDGERAYLWDGLEDELTNWRTDGIEAPRERAVGQSNQRPALGRIDDGNDTFASTSAWEVFFTFYNNVTGAESPPSRILRAGTGSSGGRDFLVKTGYAKIGAGQTADGKLGAGKGFWAVPAGVTHIRVYRSDADTPGVWYLVGSAVGGLTDVAADTEGDEIQITVNGTTKESASPLSGFIGPPQGVNVACTHVQRIWVCGSPQFRNRLWWTEAGGFNFSATQFIEVSRPGDPIVGLCSFPLETPTLGIFNRNSVWALSGYDETTFAAGLRQKADGPGCLAGHAIKVVNGVAYFWGSEGFYRFDGQTVEPIDRGVRRYLLDRVRGVAAVA